MVFIDAIHQIFEHPAVKQQTIFHENDLENIWDDKEILKYKAEILDIMLSHKLCYLMSGRRYFVPHLLPINHQEYEEISIRDFWWEYQYGETPRDFLTQLICEDLIETSSANLWSKGAHFTILANNMQMIMLYNYEKHKLKIVLKEDKGSNKMLKDGLMQKFANFHQKLQLVIEGMTVSGCPICAFQGRQENVNLFKQKHQAEKELKCKRGHEVWEHYLLYGGRNLNEIEELIEKDALEEALYELKMYLLKYFPEETGFAKDVFMLRSDYSENMDTKTASRIKKGVIDIIEELREEEWKD